MPFVEKRGLSLYDRPTILFYLWAGHTSDSGARGPWFNTLSGHILSFLLPLIHEGQLSITGQSTCMHKVLVNCLGGQSLPRKSVVMLTDHPNMTLAVYHGLKTTAQQQQLLLVSWF